MENVQLVRPKIKWGKSILDDHYEEIKKLIDLGVTIPNIRLIVNSHLPEDFKLGLSNYYKYAIKKGLRQV
ncbi:hypothetical protein [Sulfurospirillum halorespirans]|uniref:hypothetical protein n=1 Tax=Sulfurospirillum halorespirans TaxID=194424 RepID=UPI00084A1DAD|nr:hypothetical protein [Sulfurospirillum halorespirans]